MMSTAASASTAADPFTYAYVTPASCAKAGCNRPHLVLKDLAEQVGRAWEGERAGKNLRDAIRSEVVFGRTLKGTKKVPASGEIRSNQPQPSRKDFRRHPRALGSTTISLASLSTGRNDHYWHLGDPDIMSVKRLLIREIPANLSLGQDCAICLNNAHDTRDPDEVYCRETVCPHSFHLSCIRDVRCAPIDLPHLCTFRSHF